MQDDPNDNPSQRLARIALACLDLTSLNDDDDEAAIAALCRRAVGPFGPVAAVCVWPRLAAVARAQLPPQIAVAAVANFPDGGTDLARVRREAAEVLQAGAQELDLVLPWRALRDGDEASCAEVIRAARRAAPGLRLKLIVESGELADPRRVRRAAEIGLAEGVDFLKTSTGKVPVGATPEAAQTLLEAIAADPAARDRVGFKASGGVRTVADATLYIALVAQVLGESALDPARFRIGASSLLNDIEALLGAAPGPGAGPASAPGY